MRNHDRTQWAKPTAGFNRRMRKTACPVVWEGHGAQSPCPDPIIGMPRRNKMHRMWFVVVDGFDSRMLTDLREARGKSRG